MEAFIGQDQNALVNVLAIYIFGIRTIFARHVLLVLHILIQLRKNASQNVQIHYQLLMEIKYV